VPAFPQEPSPTHPTRCCQHTLVYKKKKVTRFYLAHRLWTSLYLQVVFFNECQLFDFQKSVVLKEAVTETKNRAQSF